MHWFSALLGKKHKTGSTTGQIKCEKSQIKNKEYLIFLWETCGVLIFDCLYVEVDMFMLKVY